MICTSCRNDTNQFENLQNNYFYWVNGDKKRGIPPAPPDISSALVCRYCFVELFDYSLEQRVRAALKQGNFTTPLVVAKNYLYAKSNPAFPREDSNVFELLLSSQYDSLLFSLDVARLSFDQALFVLQKVKGHSTVMFKTFYEGCSKRFKSHGDWYEMHLYRPSP